MLFILLIVWMFDFRFNSFFISMGFDIVYISGVLLLRFFMGIFSEIFDEIRELNILYMDCFV